MVWYVRNGWPRQLMVMKEKSLCSILFHCVLQKHMREGVMTQESYGS